MDIYIYEPKAECFYIYVYIYMNHNAKGLHKMVKHYVTQLQFS